MSILSDEGLAHVRSLVVAIAQEHNVAIEGDADTGLVGQGLTSTAMVELMLSIEREFDLTIPDRDLTPENFFSISTLAALLERLGALPSATHEMPAALA